MDKASKFSCPSFFKLLMDDDINHGIRIPNSFSIELEKSESLGNYSLVTGENRRSSDRSWPVKLEKKGHYYYICKLLWPLFVRDYSLEHGDYLLFHLTGKTTFFVTPYAPNGSKKMLCSDDDGCSGDDDDDDKDFDSRKSESDDRDERGTGEQGYNKDGDANSRKDAKEMMKRAEEAEEMDGYCDSSAEKPYFIRTMTEHNKSRVSVPALFAAVEAMLDKAAGKVELRWEDGAHKKKWTARMIIRRDGHIDIGRGWNDFWKQFDIQVGETYRFVIVNRRDPVTISVHKYTPNDRRN